MRVEDKIQMADNMVSRLERIVEVLGNAPGSQVAGHAHRDALAALRDARRTQALFLLEHAMAQPMTPIWAGVVQMRVAELDAHV